MYMMSEKVDETAESGAIEMDNSDMITFDNPIIMKELGNIVNLVRNEDFLETVPKAKLKRVKWVPMFNCLKQGIFVEIVRELTSMWEYENMAVKLDLLEKQREKFGDVNEDQTLWRPQLADVKSQLRASDVANLQEQKALLKNLAIDYEDRVNQLKKTLSAKRGYIKALQMDIQKYQKKNNEFITKINERFDNHEHIINTVLPDKIDIKKCWKEDLDEN